MLFASQVFVRIEIKHFLPIEFLRLPAVPIDLAVIVLCPRLSNASPSVPCARRPDF